jgi:diguanylate cyclase (GGDEF)-like protein/PAS domain S-box-containing protein
MRRHARFRPFAARGRLVIVLIVITFSLSSAATVALSIWTTSRSQHRAALIQVAARQRTLAERYVNDVLLRQRGLQADPQLTGRIMAGSVHALLHGGTAPAVNGDDDPTVLPAVTGSELRAQLMQEQRLVGDLMRTGTAILAGRPGTVPLTAHEHLTMASPVQRLRTLEALTSNVALNAARTIATADDRNIASLLTMQVVMGVSGLLLSLLLAWALVRATRRQTAHFQTLVTSSSDLVLVLSVDGCRYASHTLVSMLGSPEAELLGAGFARCVHDDDRAAVEETAANGAPARLLFRVRNAAGDWRHLDAHITDLRHDRHIQGVVVNARDISERVRLERELTEQARRDTFAGQLVEALEIADEESAAHDVVERAMVEIDRAAPMELLLSDSSRTHLKQAATSPTAGAPGCPVGSPFSCVSVRRGNPVVFESSEALNACPKLRDRPEGTCSAVCVPISFMGRALGVLHSTGPVGVPADREKIAQLTTLAAQAGARIGTVRAFERTQLQAATDEMTGLDNRRTFERHLRDVSAHRGRFAVALADLDSFKLLNDKHGHEAGDRALRLFAQVALDTVRDGDRVGRWGGEEFMILFPGSNQDQAVKEVERIRTALAAAHTGDHPRFTVSFGVADSSSGGTVQELVQVADAALYRAKQGGRDQVQTFGDLPAARMNGNGNGNGRPAREELEAEGSRPARSRSLFHQAAVDDDPAPAGIELR